MNDICQRKVSSPDQEHKERPTEPFKLTWTPRQQNLLDRHFPRLAPERERHLPHSLHSAIWHQSYHLWQEIRLWVNRTILTKARRGNPMQANLKYHARLLRAARSVTSSCPDERSKETCFELHTVRRNRSMLDIEDAMLVMHARFPIPEGTAMILWDDWVLVKFAKLLADYTKIMKSGLVRDWKPNLSEWDVTMAPIDWRMVRETRQVSLPPKWGETVDEDRAKELDSHSRRCLTRALVAF